MHSSDPTQYDRSNRQLCLEIEIALITQFIKSSSHNAVVSNLNETACFADVDDVADGEIALLERNACSVLEDLVPEIALGLK